jgi:hypothetical protein
LYPKDKRLLRELCRPQWHQAAASAERPIVPPQTRGGHLPAAASARLDRTPTQPGFTLTVGLRNHFSALAPSHYWELPEAFAGRAVSGAKA